MRVAALYDVHGNLPALEAVLADPRFAAADVVVSGGDLCAGPMPVEVLRLMQEHDALFVRGNADRNLKGWPAGCLTEEELEVLRGWRPSVDLDVEGLGRVLFCHGTPRALLGPGCQLVNTEYDVDAAVAAIRATGHPETDDIVETLLIPHGAAEANEVFEARREAASGAS